MTPCIEFKGARTAGGYGQKMIAGKRIYMHRFVWAEAYGPIPKGMHVLHRCDNPPCINVSHLFLGTHADNVADMIAKGRGGNRGETNGNAKLTWEDAEAIRASSERVTDLAKRYGVAHSVISNIRRGKAWKAL